MDEEPSSPEELRELARLTARFVAVGEVLLLYVRALSGRPNPQLGVCGGAWTPPDGRVQVTAKAPQETVGDVPLNA